jgi:hypothetical protein
MRRLLCILSDSYLVGNKFKFYLEKNILKREIIKTLDDSTIQIKDWDECYHSKHGNSEEAEHVFIKNGLSLFKMKVFL